MRPSEARALRRPAPRPAPACRLPRAIRAWRVPALAPAIAAALALAACRPPATEPTDSDRADAPGHPRRSHPRIPRRPARLRRPTTVSPRGGSAPDRRRRSHRRRAPATPHRARRGGAAAGASDELFDADRVPRFEIELPPASMAALAQDPKTYVRGTFRYGSEVVSDIGVRIKGEATLRALAKAAFKLKFDEFVPNQIFRGLRRLTLNNMIEDATFLAERLAYHVFRAAGLPAPRANSALVTVNGSLTVSTPTSRPRTRPSCAAGSPTTAATCTKRAKRTSCRATSPLRSRDQRDAQRPLGPAALIAAVRAASDEPARRRGTRSWTSRISCASPRPRPS